MHAGRWGLSAVGVPLRAIVPGSLASRVALWHARSMTALPLSKRAASVASNFLSNAWLTLSAGRLIR
jgi:hypothetical protein